MASATPFLTTDVGNASEIVERFKAGMVLPTNIGKDGFSSPVLGPSAELIELLHRDPVGRRELGNNGRRAWERMFTWSRIASSYEELYVGLMNSARPGTSDEKKVDSGQAGPDGHALLAHAAGVRGFR